MIHSPVRFAIASPARWGRLLLDSVVESQLLEFGGVWSRSEENRRGIVRKYGGESFSSYEEALADDSIEVVVLPTPHFLHYPQTIAAFEAGKHVFVEKPIANSLDEAVRMDRKSRETRLVLAVGLQLRRTGGARKAKAMIDSGELGEIALVRGVLGQRWCRSIAVTSGKWIPKNVPEARWTTSRSTTWMSCSTYLAQYVESARSPPTAYLLRRCLA